MDHNAVDAELATGEKAFFCYPLLANSTMVYLAGLTRTVSTFTQPLAMGVYLYGTVCDLGARIDHPMVYPT